MTLSRSSSWLREKKMRAQGGMRGSRAQDVESTAVRTWGATIKALAHKTSANYKPGTLDPPPQRDELAWACLFLVLARGKPHIRWVRAGRFQSELVARPAAFQTLYKEGHRVELAAGVPSGREASYILSLGASLTRGPEDWL